MFPPPSRVTHEYSAIGRNAGVCIIDVVDATIVKHSGGVSLIYSVIGKVDCIGIHDASNTGRDSRLA